MRGHLELSRSDLRQKVKAAMRGANIYLPPSPGPVEEEHRFPNDITKLADIELGRQMSFWTSQLAYVNTYLARCEIDMMSYKRDLKDYELAHRKNALKDGNRKASDIRKWEAEAELAGDETWESLRDQFMLAEAIVTQLKAVQKSYEAYYNTSSRELTRRMGERDRDSGRGGSEA